MSDVATFYELQFSNSETRNRWLRFCVVHNDTELPNAVNQCWKKAGRSGRVRNVTHTKFYAELTQTPEGEKE